MTGQVGILNVGAGDTKLTFDNKNPAETIRAARIVKDMLRRGFALLIEVEQPDGSKAYQRAWDFDEENCCYIIADFDSSVTADFVPATPTETTANASAPKRRTIGRKSVPASETRAIAVARSAGG